MKYRYLNWAALFCLVVVAITIGQIAVVTDLLLAKWYTIKLFGYGLDGIALFIAAICIFKQSSTKTLLAPCIIHLQAAIFSVFTGWATDIINLIMAIYALIAVVRYGFAARQFRLWFLPAAIFGTVQAITIFISFIGMAFDEYVNRLWDVRLLEFVEYLFLSAAMLLCGKWLSLNCSTVYPRYTRSTSSYGYSGYTAPVITQATPTKTTQQTSPTPTTVAAEQIAAKQLEEPHEPDPAWDEETTS